MSILYGDDKVIKENKIVKIRSKCW